MEITMIEVAEVSEDKKDVVRGVMIDKVKCRFTITLEGQTLTAHTRNILWLIEALRKADSEVYQTQK